MKVVILAGEFGSRISERRSAIARTSEVENEEKG